MKIATLSACALVGMISVGSAVYAITPSGGFDNKSTARKTALGDATSDSDDDDDFGRTGRGLPVASDPSHFSMGTTVHSEGRVGHSKLLANGTKETYVLVELESGTAATTAPPRVDLSLVIDKSGSMREGTRLQNAISAAVSAVERLHDGDSVSVVAFDTQTELVVPTTTLSSSTRASIADSIRRIVLGGDTCISCGVEQGLSELAKARSRGGPAADVQRMLLLSDGEPTAGTLDPAGFSSIAAKAMAVGVNITTIGVDVDFNEKVMTAIAVGSNGRHYFVQNETDLTRVFTTESESIEATVATNTSVQIDLASGVELVKVYDRVFDRRGNSITVPMGGIGKTGRKTVLMKVRLPRASAGEFQLANVTTTYRDLGGQTDKVDKGVLAVELVTDASEVRSDMDGVVLDRVQRAETAIALEDANALFKQGKAEEARARLNQAKSTLDNNRPKVATTTPAKRAKDVDESFQSQNKAIDRANDGFATPPPGAAAPPAPVQARKEKAAVKDNAAAASELGF